MSEEKVYTFNEYVLGYDSDRDNDKSCLTISKILNDNMYVMSTLYDGSAEVISTILDSLQQKVEQLEKENKELKYDCSCSFHDAEELNQKLTETIDERNELDTKLIKLENIRKEAIEWCKCVINSKTTAGELPNGKRTDMGYCLDLAEPLLKILEWGKDER